MGKLLGVVDLVVDEVRSVITGEPTERQVEKAKLELASAAWAVAGPLLSTPLTGAWPQTLALAQAHARRVLRWVDQVSPQIGRRVAEEGQRAVALERLRSAPSLVEEQADELLQRLTATIEAVNRAIRLRHPRLPPDAEATPVFERAFATLLAVIVASAVERKGSHISEANVRACRDESLRAMQEWARLFGVRQAPALESDLTHDARQRAEAGAFRDRLDAQSAADDEFGLLGD